LAGFCPERAASGRLRFLGLGMWNASDPENGDFRSVEGPEGFATWEEADEAVWFLLRSSTTSQTA